MSDLRSALLPAARIVEQRATEPILGCIKIGDGKAEANNLDMEVSIDIEALDMAPTCVPARPLINALSAVGNGRISVNCTRVIVEGDRGQIGIGMLDAKGWPGPHNSWKPDEGAIRLGAEHRSVIARLTPCMSREETRYYLNGIALCAGHAVATDGHRLRAVPLAAVPEDYGNRTILPARVAQWVTATKDDFDLDVDHHAFSFVNGAVRASGRTIDGTYPDWMSERIIPNAGASLRAVFDSGEMREAVATVSALDKSRGKAVKLTAANGRVVIESKQIDFDIEARSEIIADTFGEPYSVGFNAKYLLDIFKPGLGKVTMRQERPDTPCRFVFAGSDDVVVQMAMRI